MAKRNSFLDRIAREQEAEINLARRQTRVYMLDMVTVALGRMGFREARFKKFDEALTAACEDYGKMILDDVKNDKDLWYSKDKLDAELKRYVGDLFVPYDDRYWK
jgi:hypothetical protein